MRIVIASHSCDAQTVFREWARARRRVARRGRSVKAESVVRLSHRNAAAILMKRPKCVTSGIYGAHPPPHS